MTEEKVDSLQSLYSLGLDENFIWRQNRSLSQIISKNKSIGLFYERLKKEGFDCFSEFIRKFFDTIKKHYKLFTEGKFDYTKLEPDFTSMFTNIFYCLYHYVSIIDPIFLDAKAIQLIFPLEIFDKYLQSSYARYGHTLYDELERMKSVMVNIIMQFHLKSDTKFHLRLDYNNIRIMDPFLRIHIRQVNRRDQYIQKKYLSGNFDLKKLIIRLFECHFPNVTWRYIGGKQQIQRHILALVNDTLELGLWDYKEIGDLLHLYFMKIESLVKLEIASIIDIEAGRLDAFADFQATLAEYLLECRREVAKTCIYIMTLVNDHALEMSLPFARNKQYSKKTKFEDVLDLVFFNDTRKSTKIYSIITKFLMRTKRIEQSLNKEKHEKVINKIAKDTEEYNVMLADLFQAISYDGGDIFTSSSSLMTPQTLDYFSMNDPDIGLLMEEAHHYKEALIEAFESFKMVEGKSVNEVTDANNLMLKVLNHLQHSIHAKQKQSQIYKEKFTFCLSLQNIQLILGSTALLANDLISGRVQGVKDPCLHLPLQLLWQISDSTIGQSLLLSETGWEIFQKLVEKQPLITIMVIERIFAHNSVIFRSQDTVFRQFIKIYDNIVGVVTKTLFKNGTFNIESLTNPIQMAMEAQRAPPVPVLTQEVGEEEEEKSGSEDDETQKAEIDEEVQTKAQTKTSPRMQMLQAGPSQSVNSEFAEEAKLFIGRLISMMIYNKCLYNLIDTQKANKTELRYFDLKVQDILNNLVIQGILKQIVAVSSTFKAESKYEVDLAFNFDNIMDVISFSMRDTYTLSEIKGLIFAFSFSTLKLYTKCTSRVFLGYTSDAVEEAMPTYNLVGRFDYISEVEQGISQRTTIANFITNFFVWKNNNALVKTNQYTNLEDHTSHDQGFFNSELSSYYQFQIVNSELKFIEKWAAHHAPSLEKIDQRMMKHIQSYIFEGVLPMVYKLVKGYYVLLTVDMGDISFSISQNKSLLDFLRELKTEFDIFCNFIQDRFKIQIQKASVDVLLQFAFAPVPPQPGDSTAALNGAAAADDGTNLLSGAGGFGGLLEKYKVADDNSEFDLEADELISEYLLPFRKLAGTIIRTIEETTPQKFASFVEDYSRMNAVKRHTSMLDGIFEKRQYVKPKRYNDKELEEKSIEIINTLRDSGSTLYAQAKAVSAAYGVKKTLWISLPREENSFYRFLDEHGNVGKEFMDYWLGHFNKIFNKKTQKQREEEFKGKISIFKDAPKESFECYLVRKFLEETMPISLMCFLDNLCRKVNKCKLYFFENLTTDKQRQCLIMTIHLIHTQLMAFCTFKTFQDGVYIELNTMLDKLTDIIINFADKNNKQFKYLIATVDNNYFTNGSRMIDSFSRAVDRLCEVTQTNYVKKKNFIMVGERPEIWSILTNSMRLLAEMINGPNIYCQAAIYNYSLDKLLVICERIVDDVNSQFYLLKMEIVKYFVSLSEDLVENEEEDVKVVDSRTGVQVGVKDMKNIIKIHVANIFKPSSIEKQIVILIKKLFIYVKFKKDPSFKKAQIDKIRRKFKDRITQLEAKLSASPLFKIDTGRNNEHTDLYDVKKYKDNMIELEIQSIKYKLSKIEHLENTISDFEDKDAIILPEMEDEIILNSYKELLNFYKVYSEFSDHRLLLICSEMYSMLISLADTDETFATSVRNLYSGLYCYFGDEVPGDIKSRIETNNIDRLRKREATESAVVFMFLVKTRMTVDIMLEVEKGSRVIKDISFQIHPICLFLSDESKKNFMENTDPETMAEYMLENNKAFTVEMEENRKACQRSNLFYLISLHDNLTLQRYIVWFISLVMNFMLMISARSNDNGEREYKYFTETTFTVMASAIAGYSLFLLIVWFFGRYIQNVGIANLKAVSMSGVNYSWRDYIWVYVYKSILMKTTPVQLFLHILLGILGAAYRPIFHTLHLILIILMSKTAYYVVRSITTHAKQLGITLLLALFIIFFYAFITFDRYSNRWQDDVNNNGEIVMCNDLWECWFYAVNLGFRNGGGLADSMNVEPAHGNESHFFPKFAYDITFFVLVNVISLNIIFGIIIDTFASMRDEQDRISKISNNVRKASIVEVFYLHEVKRRN
jgi:hypothetical protein